MRALFICLLLLGLGGSMVGQMIVGSEPGPNTADHEFVINAGSEGDRPPKFKSATGPQFTDQDGTIELRRNADGHFYADVRVNGSYLHMLVDTGASMIALSREDARSAGLATSIGMNDVVGEGADGAVHGEYARLDRVELGPLTAQGLDAVVLNSGQQSLLGQSFLSKFTSVQIEGDRMILR